MRLQKNVEQLLVAGSYSTSNGTYPVDISGNRVLAPITLSGKTFGGTTFKSEFRMVLKVDSNNVQLSDVIRSKSIKKITYQQASDPTSQLTFVKFDSNNVETDPYLMVSAYDLTDTYVKTITGNGDSVVNTNDATNYGFVSKLATILTDNSTNTKDKDASFPFYFLPASYNQNLGTPVKSVTGTAKVIANSNVLTFDNAVTNISDFNNTFIAIKCYIKFESSSFDLVTSGSIVIVAKVIGTEGNTKLILDRSLISFGDISIYGVDGYNNISNLGLIIASMDYYKPFEPGMFKYSITRFDVSSNLKYSVVNISNANEGSGWWKQVSEMEWFDRANEGGEALVRVRAEYPVKSWQSLVTKDAKYNMYTIQFADEMQTDLGKYAISHKTLVIAVPTTENSFSNLTTFVNAIASGIGVTIG
jgi:hypothetical protein